MWGGGCEQGGSLREICSESGVGDNVEGGLKVRFTENSYSLLTVLNDKLDCFHPFTQIL